MDIDNASFVMALDAIRAAKNREYERINCPGFNKTVDRKFCEEKKRENSLRCQLCEDIMKIRKKFVLNLIGYKKQNELYSETEPVRRIQKAD